MQEPSVPESFKERYCPLVDDAEGFISSLGRPLPKSFRVNTLKSSAQEVKERFAGYGIAIMPMPYYEDAFVSKNPEIGSTVEHFTGAIYMQELVSMLPPLLLKKELEGARFVLDGCAAPGSKTTQLAALMHNQGTVVANDIAYSRIRALKFNLEKTGTLNTVITNCDLRAFPPMPFDAVILDAPCSAEGTLRKNWDVLATWSEREIEKQSRLQKQLIIKGFDLLAPGGSLIYSTCTFAPEENECVVDWLFGNRPEAKTEAIGFEGLRASGALESWRDVDFDDRVRNSVRIWPHHNDTGGFFLAKVRK